VGRSREIDHLHLRLSTERNEMARVLLTWWRFLLVAAWSGHSKNSTFMSRTRDCGRIAAYCLDAV
jgi:hypothetical protein